MKIHNLIIGLLVFISSAVAWAQNNSVKEVELELGTNPGVEKIEIFYVDTKVNREVSHALGLYSKFHVHEICSGSIDRPCITRFGAMDYVRWGTLDVGAFIDATTGEFDSISHAKLALYEMATKNGWYATVGEISYLQDTNLKYLKFQIPLAFLVGKTWTVNVTRGGAVQIFFQAEIGGLVGLAQFDHTARLGANQVAMPVTSMLQAGGKLGLVTGVRLFNVFELGGFSQAELVQFSGAGGSNSSFRTNYGVQAGITIPQSVLSWKVSLFGQGVRSDFLYDQHMFDNHSYGTLQEDYYEMTGGLRVEF